ncbi:hypothetical protein K0038_04794 [Pseudomonas syringae]|nr:hypothetical protein [Pseudomonas syringae]
MNTTSLMQAGNHGIQKVTGVENSRSLRLKAFRTNGRVMPVTQDSLQINAKHCGPDRLKCAPG